MEQNEQLKQFITDFSKIKEFLAERFDGIDVTHNTLGPGKVLYAESATFSAASKDGIGYITAAIKFNDGTIQKMPIQFRSDRPDFRFSDLIEGIFKILQLIDAAYTEYKKTKKKDIDTDKEKEQREKLILLKQAYMLEYAENFSKDLPQRVKELSNKIVQDISWIYENLIEIKAVIATPLVSWFKSNFGENVQITESSIENLPTTAKTGFSVEVKFNSVDGLPESFAKYVSVSTKSSKNLLLVLALLTEYGFKSGTKEEQNLEKISQYFSTENTQE